MSGRIDGWLILAAVSIFGASLANLYAVSPAVGRGLFLRQAVFGCVALVLFWVCSSIRVTAWQQAAPMQQPPAPAEQAAPAQAEPAAYQPLVSPVTLPLAPALRLNA